MKVKTTLGYKIGVLKYKLSGKVQPYIDKVRFKLFSSLIETDERSFFKWLENNYSHEVWHLCYKHEHKLNPPTQSAHSRPGYPKCVDNSNEAYTMVSSPAGEIYWIKANPEIALKNLGKHALDKVQKEQSMRRGGVDK